MTSNQSPTKTPLFLFAWRKAICEQGPTGAVTRAVLQALSAYMNEHGENAFPSIATLARDTGLSMRTVGKHLKFAEADGWFTRKRWRANGKDWAQYRYVPTLPARIIAAAQRSDANANGAERQAIGAEPQRPLVRNDVPTNSSMNSIYNSTSSAIPNIELRRAQCSELLAFLKRKNQNRTGLVKVATMR